MTEPVVLIVTPDPAAPQRGALRCGAHVFPCMLGESGARTDKREGDGATPVGRFALRRVLYRPDQLTTPKTGLPATPVARDDGWCDAPGDAQYNKPVKLPYPASAENMWRDDAVYDVVVILGHNDDPIVPGAGSAVFMHVTNGQPTAGCVALRREDLLTVLEAAGPGSVIDIRAP